MSVSTQPGEACRAQWVEHWARFHAGAWAPHTTQLLADLIQPGDLFVDVGAWIGPGVVWARRLGARVLAFEPDPVAFAELTRRHCEDPMVVMHQHAVVAARTSSDRAYLSTKPGGGFGDSGSHLGASGVMVRTVTLPNVLTGLPRPRLVTIDIEGGEHMLMPTLGPWLARRRIPVQVSCHGPDLPAACFVGYRTVMLRANTAGCHDVVALP